MVAILRQPPALVPALPGWIAPTYRSYKGKRLGPYFVRRWKVGKKIHKHYIKHEELEAVRAACQTYKAKKKNSRAIDQWLTDTWANLTYLQRAAKWSIQGRLRPQDVAYVERIEKEGYAITGRPPLRRKITRHIEIIKGEQVLVETVLELDGATKVFVVPFLVNPVFQAIGSFEKLVNDTLGAVRQKWKTGSPSVI